MLWKDTSLSGELESGDCEVLTAAQVRTGSSVAARLSSADYEIARAMRGRSTPVRKRLWFLERKPVPEAGELQANVSLANADKYVADGS
jgi:hypothetical protein